MWSANSGAVRCFGRRKLPWTARFVRHSCFVQFLTDTPIHCQRATLALPLCQRDTVAFPFLTTQSGHTTHLNHTIHSSHAAHTLVRFTSLTCTPLEFTQATIFVRLPFSHHSPFSCKSMDAHHSLPSRCSRHPPRSFHSVLPVTHRIRSPLHFIRPLCTRSLVQPLVFFFHTVLL